MSEQRVCYDLIPLIVSYASYETLYNLSKASPIFDTIICRQGTRALFCRNERVIKLYSNDRVIMLDSSGELIVIGRTYYWNCKDFLHRTYCVRNIMTTDIIPGNVESCDIDIKRMIVVCRHYLSNLSFTITKLKKIVADATNLVVTTNVGEYTISMRKVSSTKVVDTLEYDFYFIDFENEYVMNNDTKVRYSKFRTLYSDGNWHA